jgi:DNA-directed RNA polymerase subunit RPC12/RpoP
MTVIKASIDHNQEKQGHNYVLLKDDKILCANCNKELINVVKVKNNEEQHAIKSSCPYCNDESFWYQIDGKIFMLPMNNLRINNVTTNVRNSIKFTEIEVLK